MIRYLKQYFSQDEPEPGFSLAITSGRGGARLSHSHQRQYTYVIQSLTLWREVLQEMLGLWGLAEKDLLNSNNPYRLRDTGQGLNRLVFAQSKNKIHSLHFIHRVQNAPHVSHSMQKILDRVQHKVSTSSQVIIYYFHNSGRGLVREFNYSPR